MKTFRIPISWAMGGTVEVQAESLEDAIYRAKHDPLVPLPVGEYLDESLEVDRELAHELNSEDSAVKEQP